MIETMNFTKKVDHPFRVHKVMPMRANDYAHDFQRIIRDSWKERFHGMLSDEAIEKIANSADPKLINEQRDRIAKSGDKVLYFVARSLEHPQRSVGLLRVEEYSPRNPFKRSYPSITDLEVHEPRLFPKGQLSDAGGALLYIALRQYSPNANVSFYSEAPNEAMNELLGSVGFEEAARPKPEELVEQLGDESIQYVHFMAKSVQAVQNNVADTFPFIHVN